METSSEVNQFYVLQLLRKGVISHIEKCRKIYKIFSIMFISIFGQWNYLSYGEKFIGRLLFWFCKKAASDVISVVKCKVY